MRETAAGEIPLRSVIQVCLMHFPAMLSEGALQITLFFIDSLVVFS